MRTTERGISHPRSWPGKPFSFRGRVSKPVEAEGHFLRVGKESGLAGWPWFILSFCENGRHAKRFNSFRGQNSHYISHTAISHLSLT